MSPERHPNTSAVQGETVNARPPEFSPDGAVLLVISGNAKGNLLRLPGVAGTVVYVGKAPENDLVLPDETVSRRHLSVERSDAGLIVRDLESTNGLRIGGALVREAVVGPGTQLSAGSVELLVAVEMQNAAIPPSTREEFGLAVGTSVAMRQVFGVLECIAPTLASVLLIGETGTGKDALARSIHATGPRALGPFEVVDCGAVSGALIESELFGHERGAFTGAVASRAGAFERADGGTLFLDEIGELAPDLQPKLLRVLETRSFRRVGGNKLLTSDVRVVAATTRNLAREVQRGAFRDDLYFRLAVVTIRVPPLRERLDDIPRLVQRLLATVDPHAKPVAPAVLAALKAYDWPGNVRELRNVIERALYITNAMGASELSLEGFPPLAEPVSPEHDAHRFVFNDSATYRETRARYEASFERAYVDWLLRRHDWNVSAAARAVRMDRTHLMDLAKKHGIERGK